MYSIKSLDNQTHKEETKAIPKHPFSLLINASKGAGKTTLLLNLLKFYKGIFDRILLFSPTVKLDEKWMNFINKNQILKPKNFKSPLYFNQPEENLIIHEIHTEYSNKIIQDLRKSQEEKKTKDNILVIFEDSIGLEGVYKQNSQILKYLPNSRHLKTSFIFVSQNYKSIPRLIRNNNSGIVIFETANHKELEMIYEENPCFLTKDKWMEIYDYIMKKPYNFMFINYQNKKECQILKNFESVIKKE